MREEILEEIQDKVLNLILFDEMITKSDKNRLLSNLISDYFNGLNKKIFDYIKKLEKEKKEINILKLLEMCKDNPDMVIQLEVIRYSTPLCVQIKYYLNSLYENYIDSLIQESKTVEDYKKIDELKEKLKPIPENIKKLGDDIEGWEEKYLKKENNGMMTFYHDLDNTIGSFQGGDYIALGGATGQGKTMFALNLAWSAILQEKRVLYCSLEMPLEQLQNRMNCIIQGINTNKIRNHDFSESELQKYKQGLDDLKQLDFHIVTDYKLTTDKLENYIKKIKPDFVVIDYLGLMSYNGNSSLYEKITAISREVKLIATAYNIPILVLVQLNRDIKNRDNKIPKLSDIRESGAIEQDSDFVLFTHREYAYNTSVNKNLLQVSVAKNRHGEANKIINLRVNLATQKVSNYEQMARV